MRIVGGRLKGARLQVTPGTDIRPTADRVREAVFSMLESGRFDVSVRNALVLDVFAGSGAMGLEALSRGAERATFLELNPKAARTLKATLARLRVEDLADIITADATRPPPPPASAREGVEIAFLDPPYRKGLEPATLEALGRLGWLKPNALVLVEMEKGEVLTPPQGFRTLESRRWGRTEIHFLSHMPPAADLD